MTGKAKAGIVPRHRAIGVRRGEPAGG